MRLMPSGEMFGSGLRKEVRLLVVDDHSDHFEHLQAHAEMYSSQFAIECKLVADAAEARPVVESWIPSVVLVDTHLISDSLAFMKELAEMGAAVVAVSEKRIPELVETCQQHGAVGYFTKSDNPDDVEALIGFIASVASKVAVSH